MPFQKYMHIERFGTDEVDGINLGTCYVYPKIDGTNGSIWMDDGELKCASRNRELSEDHDNHGFYKWVQENKDAWEEFFHNHDCVVYGEWLEPHTLKTYYDEAWRKFYVFDVYTKEGYPTNYSLNKINIPAELIPCIGIVQNGSYEQFVNLLDNNYLIKNGQGFGEGIVIKNYEYRNKYGRQVWAKIVRSEFKTEHARTMGAPEINGSKMVEEQIADKFCTETFVKKEFAKFESFSSKNIAELLGRIFYTLVNEEAWNMVKDFNYPKIDFKTLRHFVIVNTKKHLPEVFS